MANMDSNQIALIVLATGLVVVFVALIVLIFVIKAYSGIVRKLQAKPKEHAPAPKPHSPHHKAHLPVQEADVPDEVVAVIAAAIYAAYGSGHVIRSVRRTPQKGARSAWAQAGLQQNTRPF